MAERDLNIFQGPLYVAVIIVAIFSSIVTVSSLYIMNYRQKNNTFMQRSSSYNAPLPQNPIEKKN